MQPKQKKVYKISKKSSSKKIAYRKTNKKKRVRRKATKRRMTKKGKTTRRQLLASRSSSKPKFEKAPDLEAAVTVRNGRTRIDFEDLLIQGQLKRANTVYLFERGEEQLRSLVKKKEDFRQEIYENYLD